MIFEDPAFDSFINPTRDGVIVARKKWLITPQRLNLKISNRYDWNGVLGRPLDQFITKSQID
jgi:hypothetical protein